MQILLILFNASFMSVNFDGKTKAALAFNSGSIGDQVAMFTHDYTTYLKSSGRAI